MKPVLVFGGGGHAKAVIDALKLGGRYRIVGIIDSFREPGELFCDLDVVGTEAQVPALVEQYECSNFCVAVGDNYQRQAISHRLAEVVADIAFVTVIHTGSIVSPSATLEAGCVVMSGAIVGPGATIGTGCLVNTRASIDHDCVLAPFSSVAPGATLGGGVHLGERSSIGLGASVRERVKVGADTVVGVGAAVVGDIPNAVVAYGVPCRAQRTRLADEPYLG